MRARLVKLWQLFIITVEDFASIVLPTEDKHDPPDGYDSSPPPPEPPTPDTEPPPPPVPEPPKRRAFDGVCPVCRGAGFESTVRDRELHNVSEKRPNTSGKDESFYDEHGTHHFHQNGAKTWNYYLCSNGHRFDVCRYYSCGYSRCQKAPDDDVVVIASPT